MPVRMRRQGRARVALRTCESGYARFDWKNRQQKGDLMVAPASFERIGQIIRLAFLFELGKSQLENRPQTSSHKPPSPICKLRRKPQKCRRTEVHNQALDRK